MKPVQRWNVPIGTPLSENNESGELVMHDEHQLVVDALQSRVAELEEEVARLDRESASALMLVARIREALGDGGERMQDELLAYCRELRAGKEAEQERCHRAICDHLEIHEIDHLAGPELDATVRRVLEAH